jgi:hypothetical protein
VDSSSRDIINAIRVIAGIGNEKKANFMTATVTNVSEKNRTCEAKVILGTSNSFITEIKLITEKNDGYILIPKKDTDILICIMPDNTSYMVSCNDIDKVICVIDSSNKYEFDSAGFIFNNGTFGGLAKSGVLASKISKLETEINTLKTIISSIISAGTTSPTTPVLNSTLGALFASFNITPIINTTQIEIENNRIKH